MKDCLAAKEIIDNGRASDGSGGVCLGFILGWQNAHITIAYKLKKRGIIKNIEIVTNCVPEGQTCEQDLLVILKFLKDHPEKLNKPAFYSSQSSSRASLSMQITA